VSEFDFIDLFCGIGGFHAVLSAIGGRGVLAAEIDKAPARVYEDNWGLRPARDVVELAATPELIPEHAVLAGGFPCQPFSKSGMQLGMAERRGQLFDEVLKILASHRPPVVFLENVRNIAGPRQELAWKAVVLGLRSIGYRVSSEPCVFSPHLLPPSLGGAPQVRDRVYILGTYVGASAAVDDSAAPAVARRPVDGWNPKDWDLEKDVMLANVPRAKAARYRLTQSERQWIRVWNNLLAVLPSEPLPGHPLWADYWRDDAEVDQAAPLWKRALEAKNIDFYRKHRAVIRKWLRANSELHYFPQSRRKLEWQAQDAPRDLMSCLLHFRPSGIRVKKPTYAPALVAMTQTPVHGPTGRRLMPREAARLQGFPDWFDFGPQSEALIYKQLGNAINIGAAYYVFRSYVMADARRISAAGPLGDKLLRAVLDSPEIPLIKSPAFLEQRV
jgi:DNA (cytosine-5)-methyltransferase 1